MRLFLVILALSLASTSLLAQQKSVAVKRLEKERREALEAVAKTDRELKTVRNNRSKKQQEEKLLRRKEREQKKVVDILDKEVKNLERELDSLSVVVTNLQREEERRMRDYEKSVVSIQQRQNSSDRLLFIFASKDFDQAVRRIRFISEYASAHHLASQELKKTRQEKEATQRTIAANKASKTDLLALRENERKKLSQQRQATKSEIASLQGKEKSLQQQRKKYQQRANALNKRIEEQIAKEIAEANKKAKADKGSRKATTKGGFAMTAEERKLSGSFASNKGRLLMPVSGKYTIVSRFGVQQHKEASKVQTNNSGIDIAVPSGSKARAVFEGTVTSVFVLSGYNNSIIIRHGNYLTVYANLVNIQVKKGDKVKTGQTLGTIATSEGNTILHFQLWHERTKQNPELWIR